MSAFRAARVEQEIVKIPENEVVVALGRPQAAVAGVVDLEQDLAIHEQGEQLEPGKTILPSEPSDRLRHGQSRRWRPRSSGSQILNSAPARGDSSTIALPRRRR